jgi:hypothetical protein
MMHAFRMGAVSLLRCASNRPGGRRELAGPAALGAALAAAALGAAACGSQAAAVRLPARPQSVTPAPAVLAQPSRTPRQQVTRAYRGYWLAYAAAMTAGRPGQARTILAPFESPSGMTQMIRSLRKVWAAHDVAYGGAITHVKSVRVSGRRALLHDCLDLSHFGVLDSRSGRVVPGSFGLPSQDFYVSLELSGGRWKVANMQPVEVPCSP